MRVVKIGGSLLTDKSALIHCLEVIEAQQPLVIVVGGGLFADQVRMTQAQYGFSDVTAHQMAILAMQQTALLLQGLKPNFVIVNRVNEISDTLLTQAVVIWSPCIRELDQAKIPARWDITSDSLSAWLATQLGACELILLKSAQIEANNPHLVDNTFQYYTAQAPFKITFIHKHGFDEHIFTESIINPL